jgi:D-alanyl-D-alanine carboxypeptidase (penicillin-binding protein 5/6)
MFRILVILLFSVSFAFAAPKKRSLVSPVAKKIEPAKASCRGMVLMDARTGEILFEENAREKLRPASMVKLMLSYVVLQKIKDGELRLSDIVTASARAAKVGGSQVYLKQGEQFSVDDLLKAVMIQSANDACIALAEHISGSVEAFVALMNETAEDLGLKEADFRYAHGLPPNAGEEPDLVSAYDMALLSKRLIEDHPRIIEYSSILEQPFRDGKFIMRSHNKLLSQGADGLKTGYYAEAGFSISATATRSGERMIAVVMGCNDRKFRDAEALRLLNKGFATYKPVRLIKKGESAGLTRVVGGAKSEVPLFVAEDFRASIKSGEEARVVKELKGCKDLKAPVKALSPCGELVFKLEERELGVVPVLTSEEVLEATGVKKLLGVIGW